MTVPCHICKKAITESTQGFTGFDWVNGKLKHLCSYDCLREDGRRTLSED